MNLKIIIKDNFFQIHKTIPHHLFQHFQLLSKVIFCRKFVLNYQLLIILKFKLLFFYVVIFAKLN